MKSLTGVIDKRKKKSPIAFRKHSSAGSVLQESNGAFFFFNWFLYFCLQIQGLSCYSLSERPAAF